MSKQVKNEAVDITVISIDAGIIQLIEPNGKIGYYRQTGIEKIDSATMQMLMVAGCLHKDWSACQVIPTHYRISYEDPEIMGRALKTYKIPRR